MANVLIVDEQVLSLKNLQILDCSYNHVTIVPEDISKMYSLMFLAMEGNRIKRLPVCIGDMTRLTKVKFGNNPLDFPPREIMNVVSSSANVSQMEESRQICTQLKSYLKDYKVKEHERRRGEAYETMSVLLSISLTSFTDHDTAAKPQVKWRPPVPYPGGLSLEDFPFDLASPILKA